MRPLFILMAVLPSLALAGLSWEETEKSTALGVYANEYAVTFSFKNTSRNAVTIKRVQGSCSCIDSIEYPKEGAQGGNRSGFKGHAKSQSPSGVRWRG